MTDVDIDIHARGLTKAEIPHVCATCEYWDIQQVRRGEVFSRGICRLATPAGEMMEISSNDLTPMLVTAPNFACNQWENFACNQWELD